MDENAQLEPELTADESPPSPEIETEPTKRRKWRRVKRAKKLDDSLPTDIEEIKGVVKIILTPHVQNQIGCAVGIHVTSENPWANVPKELLVDNLELHEESSEFLLLKQVILDFPRKELLVLYIPDVTREYDEFYMCTTAFAEDAVRNIIDNILKEREERIKNTILKTVGTWKTLGSEKEIDAIKDKGNRGLLEVELEWENAAIHGKTGFKFRTVENACDGYTELLAPRQTFENVTTARLDVGIQVTPAMCHGTAQTDYPYPKMAQTQYEFDYKPVEKLSKTFAPNIRSFMRNKMDGISDTLHVNGNLNFYTNDYANLVQDMKATVPPIVWSVKPYITLLDPSITKLKEIASFSWHPLWTGTVAVAYLNTKPYDNITFKPNVDSVWTAMYDVCPVLLWSFTDTIHPKLLLETPRDVSELSFCPYDENILVGGCVNGQIVIWDITDKLKGVEEEEILTTDQIKYRNLMASLVGWMKNTKNAKVVPTTIVSDLEYSHSTRVTTIRWVSAYREVSRLGKITPIPEDEERSSIQFMTSSTDGKILIWDLKSPPASRSSHFRPQKKLRRLQKRPSALTLAVSPLRAFNRIFKPIFEIDVMHPNNTRPLCISELNLRATGTQYVEKYPNPNRKFDMSKRILYKPILMRPTDSLVSQVIAGTTEGDFITISWDGYEYNSGAVLNSEIAKFSNFGSYHDGPITAIARSEVFPNIVLTVGGKIFAIWNVDFVGRPVIYRRGKYRYTHAMWHTFRPSLFRLSRADGSIEIWHLLARSDRYIDLVPLSATCIGRTATHPLPLTQSIFGAVMSQGLFKLYYISRNLTVNCGEDRSIIPKMCSREIERKTIFLNWQERWRAKHMDFINARKAEMLLRQQEREEEIKLEKELLHAELEQEKLKHEIAAKEISKPEPGKFTQWMQQQLMAQEIERAKRIVLAGKLLNMDALEKQKMPVVRIAQEKEQKVKRQEQRQQMAQKFYDDTVTLLLHDAADIMKEPPPPDPYAGGDSQESQVLKAFHYQRYLESIEQFEELVGKREYKKVFRWLEFKKNGEERRKVLDGYYWRYTHHDRLVRERELRLEEEDARRQAALTAKQKPQSLGSIEYVIRDTEEVEEPTNVHEDDGDY